MPHLPITTEVKIDWNNDGDFSDANEDVSADAIGFSWSRGRSDVRDAFSMGTAQLELENSSGRYSPFNTGSAIYGNMLPGRLARVRLTHNSVNYDTFYGRLADIAESRAPDGAPIVRLTLEDDFGRLSRTRYQTPASMLDGTTVSATHLVIALDAGYTVVPSTVTIDTSLGATAAFWHTGSHLEAAQTVTKQELGGAFYIGAGGKWTFRNRQYASGQSVHATFSGVQALDMDLRQSDYYNKVIHRRAGLDTDSATAPIFNLFPTGRAIAPGSTDPLNTFDGEYIAAAKNVVQPVAVLDYTANAISDGSGEDVTDKVSVSAFTSYGGAFQITLNNVSGQTAYLTYFQVRGQAVRQSSEAREITVSGSGPVSGQTLRDEFAFSDDVTAIRAYAQFRLYAGTTLYPRRLTVRLVPRSDAEAVSILGLELLKRLTITNTTGLYPTTINDDFIVQSIRGRVVPGQTVEYDVGLWHEIAALGNFFRISGASGGGADYSTISSAVATAGDRIGY